jgi:exopolysaccharide biosynthesis protein
MNIPSPAAAAAATDAQPAATPETPAATNASQDVSPTPEPTPTPAPGDFSATFPTGEMNAAGFLGSYADDNLRISITENHTDDAIYYVADVWIRNIQEYKTAFAGGKFNGGYAMPNVMASKQNAILALSGDCYKARPEGIVIRNGTLYRDTLSGDVCVLYSDGVMESYYESGFDLNDAVARGAYQAWCFGPKLIDNGQVPSSYNTTDKIISHNPRAAIGYFAPGHYCLVYVDGRGSDNSSGLTLDELSQIMIDLGCKDAYNLDGGQSSMMVFQGQIIGSPYKGGRDISDIIYFGGDDPQ